MDKDYIRIGDFAKLRGTTKRAIRYYEELGLLKPTLDPEKGNYRYFHENQLFLLDIIRLFNLLGVNLKDLAALITEDETLQYQEILDLCIIQCGEKIRQFQNMKQILLEMQLCLKDCSAHANETGSYIRPIVERKIIVRKLPGFGNYFENQTELAALYKDCDRRGITYCYTYGILQKLQGNSVDYYVFTQILNDEATDPDIIVLPAGDYLCFQNNTRDMELPDSFLPVLNTQETSLIISTFMLFEKTNIRHPVYEKQVLITDSSRE